MKVFENIRSFFSPANKPAIPEFEADKFATQETDTVTLDTIFNDMVLDEPFFGKSQALVVLETAIDKDQELPVMSMEWLSDDVEATTGLYYALFWKWFRVLHVTEHEQEAVHRHIELSGSMYQLYSLKFEWRMVFYRDFMALTQTIIQREGYTDYQILNAFFEAYLIFVILYVRYGEHTNIYPIRSTGFVKLFEQELNHVSS